MFTRLPVRGFDLLPEFDSSLIVASLLEIYPFQDDYMAMGQNLSYLFSRDYHLCKRLSRVTGGTGF